MTCVDPNAPEVPCCVCGKLVKTCERTIPIGPENAHDYRCSEHPNGCEVEDGQWVCSNECWDKAVGDVP